LEKTMLEEILFGIQESIPRAGEFGQVSPEVLPLTILCCVMGAFVLTKFTGSLGNLTLAVNFSALFIGAMTSNWLLNGVDLYIDKVVAQPILVSTIGMTMASLIMMGWLQRDGMKS
jgi:hypothetical protein